MTDHAQDWTRASLLALLSGDSQRVRLDRLRRLGVLDDDHHVTARATSWGSQLPHTAVEDDEPESTPDKTA